MSPLVKSYHGWIFFVLGLFFHAFLPQRTQAETVHTPYVEAELVASTSEIVPGKVFYLALRQKIKKEWHVYWRNPGSSGEPVSFDWQLPEGFKAGEIIWPVPEVIATGPIINYVFEGEVFLPVRVEVPEGVSGSVHLKLDAFWLVCKDICIPQSASFTLPMQVKGVSGKDVNAKGEAKFSRQIYKALEETPKPGKGIIASAFSIQGDALSLKILAPFLADSTVGNLYFFPYHSGLINHDIQQKAQIGRQGIQLVFAKGPEAEDVLKKPVWGLLKYEKGGKKEYFEIKIPSGEEKLEIGQIVSHSAAWTEAYGQHESGLDNTGTINTKHKGNEHAANFILVLVFAFLGGLILNLMPCVFPVLSIKAMSLARHAHSHPAKVRWQGIFFLIGILLSFLSLAGILILFKALGAEIGWGFQLQSPIVVAGLGLLMFLIGLNFLGYFDIQISIGGQLLGLTGRSDYWGSFFTGILTVLLATPCTAPFMATAVGFALTQPWYSALVVFFSLGLGLAFPFFILSFFPGSMKFLPKPGPWMVRFKEFLAFPMLAAAVWLVWVLSRQTGSMGVLWILGAGLMIIILLWALKLSSKAWAKGLAGFAGISLLFSVYMLANLSPLRDENLSVRSDVNITKHPWSEQDVKEHTMAGKVVFANFTADWCVTCKVNEALVLNRKSLKQFLKEKEIVVLVGNWTKHDPAITGELQKYNRAGVPLYLVYPAGVGSKPYILPQLLTVGIVRKAVDKALKEAEIR